VPLGRVEGGFQVKELPLRPEPITSTVLRSLLAPFLRVTVTGPTESDQVRVKGLPASTA
jgi:hypothetical protein